MNTGGPLGRDSMKFAEKKAKCRVNWDKPYRAGTICNYVDERTNECKQTDKKRCPCGGIVRIPIFPEQHDPDPAPIGTCEWESTYSSCRNHQGDCPYKVQERDGVVFETTMCGREDAALALAEHDEKIRNEVMDEFGILHGEDAKRFHEYLNSPPDLTPEAKELCCRALALAEQEQRKEAEAGK